MSISEQEMTELDEAEALELDNAHFVLTCEQYNAFIKELDKSLREIPALRELMLNPSVIEVPNN